MINTVRLSILTTTKLENNAVDIFIEPHLGFFTDQILIAQAFVLRQTDLVDSFSSLYTIQII